MIDREVIDPDLRAVLEGECDLWRMSRVLDASALIAQARGYVNCIDDLLWAADRLALEDWRNAEQAGKPSSRTRSPGIRRPDARGQAWLRPYDAIISTR